MPDARNLQPLAIRFPDDGTLKSRLLSRAADGLNRIVGLTSLNEMYAHTVTTRTDEDFLRRTLDAFDVDLDLRYEDALRIPSTGPVVVVANHPFGAIEGVALGHLLRGVRPDAMLMANYMLSMIPEMRQYLFEVDPFGGESAAKKNIGALKQAIRHVKGGGMLGVFPAGEVSSLSLRKRAVTDPQWSPTIGRIVNITKAPVLPVFFEGLNSAVFQLAGLVHPRLRTALLPREFLRMRGRTLTVRIGKPIPYAKLSGFTDDAQLMDYLRLRTYVLKHRHKEPRKSFPVSLPKRPRAKAGPVGPEPLPAPIERELLTAEIAALPHDAVLHTSSEHTLFVAPRQQIPNIMLEIGRLRELTFRAVGEGTGKALDLDRFDDDYLHLVLWHNKDLDVVGSYRIGKTDRILESHGMNGLYTATLFKFRRAFLDTVTPSLELGRSFVQQRYQKSYTPLLVLWKGIAEYVRRNPRYRFLFGPVSISNSYSPFSRELMVRFLKSNAKEDMRHNVKAKTPPRGQRGLGSATWKDLGMVCRDIEDLGGLIAELEKDEKGVPVLLRQYLKLGGTVLAFNVDADFADALDGLILVDLLQTDQKILAKYMGADGAREFHEFHQLGEQVA